MNVRNNSLHYKMYKSKKNIVYAGLVTTAALAGLTLSNVNNTVSADTTSAADNSALTTSAANTSSPVASDSAATSSAASDNSAASSSATSEQIASASSNVVVKSAALSDANQAVASAQTNYNSAEQLNSGVSAINSAQQVVNGYNALISDAQVAFTNAQTSANAANSAATSASNVISVNNMISSASSAASNADTVLNRALQNAIAGVSGTDRNEYAPYVNQFAGQVPTSANADTLPAWKQLASNAASTVANDDAKATSAQSALNKAVADSQAVDAQLSAAQAQIQALAGASGSQALQAAQALVNSLNSIKTSLMGQINLQSARTENWLQIHDADLILSQKVNSVVSAIENMVKFQNEADRANIAVENAYQALKTLQAKQNVANQTVQSLRAKYDLPDAQGLAAMQNNINGLQALYNTAVSKLNEDGADTVGSGSAVYMRKLNTMKASEAVLKSDQAALAKAQSAANSASADVVSASAALAKADPSDIAAYAEASAKLAAAYAKQAAAQTQLTTAQNQVNGDIDQIKALQNVLEQFVTANNLQVYVDQYNQLPAQIKAAKEALNTANANLAAAKDADAALTAATVALNNAKAAATAAQKAYNDAVDYYNSLINGETPAQKSDAEKYGANIIVGGTTIYRIKSQKANSTKMALAAAYAGEANSVTAVVPAPTADQVMGGKADAIAAVKSVAWADPAKVNEDATKPGNHVEEIIVTFKDGSTKTASWNLTVLPAKDDDNTDTPTTPDTPATSDQPAQSGSTAVTPDNNVNSGATNNGVASNGTVANSSHAANTVSFGNGQAAVLPVASTSHVANTAAKKNDSATLPQTGNKNTSAVVALGAVSAMFGLGLAAKKREF